MKRTSLARTIETAIFATAIAASGRHAIRAQSTNPAPDAYSANDRAPDPRLKADILVVVAHPDDETLASAYLAREIDDEHKRVAIVYGTHGDAGNNDVGPEQASAMGQIREFEARQVASALGAASVWFLTGRDTVSQNVLNSLEHWGHGACLEQLVRIVRLTRPSVILTFLPDFTTGENHADHQAAGVLATEAFDLAGDRTEFAEQVSPATNPDKNTNLTEGLSPWQPQKIYYFYNPTHDIFTGQGPQYSSTEISPSRHLSYAALAAEAFSLHRTQGGDAMRRAIDNHALGSPESSIARMVTGPVRLIFGKSLAPSGVTDDVFAGVVSGGIPFQRPPALIAAEHSNPVLEIGDPWSYYRGFWRAHGLDRLANVVPLEITVKVGGSLAIPLMVENPTDRAISVSLSVQAPDGWEVKPLAPVSVDPHARYYLRVQATAPSTKLAGWQQFTVSAKEGNRTIGIVPIRVELSTGWVAPQ
jgi:LmbE family N-acetylglucosaminyl deacetylase